MAARILGGGGGGSTSDDSNSHLGDQPYQVLPASSPSQEINSLDDSTPAQSAPTEQTPLLTSSAPRIRPKVAKKINNVNGPAITSRPGSSGSSSGEEVAHVHDRHVRKPWRLRISFLFACVLLYVNFSFLILTLAGVNSPFIAHNALPPHRGSMFLPIWISLLSLATNLLVLVAFVRPLESPTLSSVTALLSAFFALTQLIVVAAVTQLRHRENILTIVLLAVAIVSLVHSALSHNLAEKYAPLLDPPPLRNSIPEPRFFASLKRVATGVLSFLSVSLPIVLLHLAITAAFILLTVTVIIRGFDASLEPKGQLWKVNPWRKRNGHGVFEVNGRAYNLHLRCRGVEVEPIAAGLNASINAAPVKRTILIETEQGIAGEVGSAWVEQYMKEGGLTSPDTEVRVCYYDRPGYGFSDNSPSSTVPHVVTALTEALSLSGEIARIDAHLPSPGRGVVPSPNARSGFILLSTGYGAVPSLLFAALHPRLVHSALHIAPIPPALHFAHSHSERDRFSFFFIDILSSFGSELGIRKIWSVLRARPRSRRVLSTEGDVLKGEIMRSYLQESGESHNPNSDSAKAWNNARTRLPERPTIVVSPESTSHGLYGYELGEWLGAEELFVRETVQDGLVEWVKEVSWDPRRGICEGAMNEVCRKQLSRLVKMD